MWAEVKTDRAGVNTDRIETKIHVAVPLTERVISALSYLKEEESEINKIIIDYD